MEKYTVGTRILNVNPDTIGNKVNINKTGTVYKNNGEYVYVEYDDGSTGKSDNPKRYYKIINEQPCSNGATTSQNLMTNIVTFFKNLTLSSDDKLLRKHGLMSECGDFTQVAKDLVTAKTTADNKAFLVEIAQKYEAETKENK